MQEHNQLRKLLEYHFAPLIRQPEYEAAMSFALKALEPLETMNDVSDKDRMYLLTQILILQAFKRLENVKQRLGKEQWAEL